MKSMLLFFLAVACFEINAEGQLPLVNSKTRIYLVRHAEKATVPANDPVLTELGNKRAGDLMRRLQSKNINRVYVTEFKRTQMTADSMRIQLGIETVHYMADETGVSILQKIQANHDEKKRILIIGHSNTIPVYIRMLGVINFILPEIPSCEFDNLYYIRFKKRFLQNGYKAILKHTLYGRLCERPCPVH